MPKVQKMITIDIEVFLALKEAKINVSKVVNDYLTSYLNLKAEQEESSLASIETKYNESMAHMLKLKNQFEQKKVEQEKEESRWI